MNITIEQLFRLALRFNLRIVIEGDHVSFIKGSKILDLYDIVLRKITLNDIETCIRKMVGRTDEDK